MNDYWCKKCKQAYRYCEGTCRKQCPVCGNWLVRAGIAELYGELAAVKAERDLACAEATELVEELERVCEERDLACAEATDLYESSIYQFTFNAPDPVFADPIFEKHVYQVDMTDGSSWEIEADSYELREYGMFALVDGGEVVAEFPSHSVMAIVRM